ncbi:Hsp20 family protein [Haematospirillum jordaniae]|nr:Hsp20 family protein [Haematospirillum jordaniae]
MPHTWISEAGCRNSGPNANAGHARKEVPLTRLSVFNSPLLLGFDHVERVLDRVAKSSAEGYPPYNIEQTGEHCLRITLAVAGFHEEDLSVTTEDNQLVIRGRQSADDGNRIFLHRGIASRQFQRSFVLAEGIEVVSAYMDNGLLHIDLQRPVPEPVVRQIKIGSGNRDRSNQAPQTQTIDLAPQPRKDR